MNIENQINEDTASYDTIVSAHTQYLAYKM